MTPLLSTSMLGTVSQARPLYASTRTEKADGSFGTMESGLSEQTFDGGQSFDRSANGFRMTMGFPFPVGLPSTSDAVC